MNTTETRKKKIFWITTALDESAVSTVFFSLLPFLKKYYEIVYIAIAPFSCARSRERLSKSGIVALSLESKQWQIVKAVKKCARAIRECKPDIVHAHLGRAYLVSACAHSVKKKGEKSVLLATFHNNYRYFSPLTRLALRLIFSRFHAISVVSKTCGESYDHLLRAHGCESTVLYNPQDVVRKRKQHSNKDARILLFPARLCKGKGHFLLLSMYQSLLKEEKNCWLLLAGRGPLEKRIRAFIQHKRLQKVVILGHRNDVVQLVDDADIVVFPSQDEGFGLVPCEAFLRGTPVIMQDCPVFRELFIHSRWYVRCEDTENFVAAVRNILKDPTPYIVLAEEEGDAIEARWRSGIVAEKYRNWYEKVLKN